MFFLTFLQKIKPNEHSLLVGFFKEKYLKLFNKNRHTLIQKSM